MSNITAKAFTEGSLKPVLKNGVLRLYSMRFCPFAYRVRLVLAAKNIQYETVNINLKVKPNWYLKKHPEGKVPLLEWDDKHVAESLIICDYLDEKYPEPNLWPRDPYKKAIGKLILETFAKLNGHMMKAASENDEAAVDGFQKELLNLNKHLQLLKADYFSGDKPGMVDYMIWPFMEVIRIAHYLRPAMDKISFLKNGPQQLITWGEKMLEDPVVMKCTPGQEQLTEYLQSRANGNPNYDVGL